MAINRMGVNNDDKLRSGPDNKLLAQLNFFRVKDKLGMGKD